MRAFLFYFCLQGAEYILLFLKRNRHFNEALIDTTNNSLITYGMFYYEDIDPETGKSTGLTISAENYWKLKQEKMDADYEKSDYKKWFDSLDSEQEYRQALKDAEAALRQSKVLSIPTSKDIM